MVRRSALQRRDFAFGRRHWRPATRQPPSRSPAGADRQTDARSARSWSARCGPTTRRSPVTIARHWPKSRRSCASGRAAAGRAARPRRAPPPRSRAGDGSSPGAEHEGVGRRFSARSGERGKERARRAFSGTRCGFFCLVCALGLIQTPAAGSKSRQRAVRVSPRRAPVSIRKAMQAAARSSWRRLSAPQRRAISAGLR